MQNNFIIIGSGLILRKVIHPKPEDIIIFSTENLSQSIKTGEYSEEILDSIMQGIHNLSKTNLSYGVLAQIKLGSSTAEIKKFLCTPLKEFFRERLVEKLKKIKANYVYDLVPLTQLDYKKVYGFGLAKIVRVENIFIEHDITPELRGRLKKLLEQSPSFDHEEMVKFIQALEF